MDNGTLNKQLRKLLNDELIRRMLKQYFNDKHLDEWIYPPLIADIRSAVPALFSKIEVEPYVKEYDPGTGIVKLSWNLFILGVVRVDLGMTSHKGLLDLAMATTSRPEEDVYYTPKQTVNDVIEFIIKTLSEHSSGVIDPRESIVPFPIKGILGATTNRMFPAPTMSGMYYERSGGAGGYARR